VGLPERLALIIVNGLIFGILSHDRIGGSPLAPRSEFC
jgi:hypothetical protein